MINTGIVKQILIIIVAGILGACMSLGYVRQYVLHKDNIKLLYVSEEEIMECEKNRVKDEALDKRQLFFGEIDKAVNLAVTLPKTYQNRTTKVLYSMGSIKGENVKSISKVVHQQIIAELLKDAKQDIR